MFKSTGKMLSLGDTGMEKNHVITYSLIPHEKSLVIILENNAYDRNKEHLDAISGVRLIYRNTLEHVCAIQME